MTEEKKVGKPARKPSTIENLLLGCTIQQAPKLVPGVLLSVGLVALLVWLTDLINTAWDLGA